VQKEITEQEIRREQLLREAEQEEHEKAIAAKKAEDEAIAAKYAAVFFTVLFVNFLLCLQT
jgi:hypothetical protein